MQFKRKEDRAETAMLPAPAADFSPLIGIWFNTNPDTGHIFRLDVRHATGLELHIFGSGEDDLIDWGKTPAHGYVTGTSLAEGIGFTAAYDFGFMETQLCSNHSKGVLVIQSYNRFKDDSGRADYFSREFFRQVRAGTENNVHG